MGKVCIQTIKIVEKNFRFEKITFSLVRISDSISLRIPEEHGIHCMQSMVV